MLLLLLKGLMLLTLLLLKGLMLLTLMGLSLMLLTALQGPRLILLQKNTRRSQSRSQSCSLCPWPSLSLSLPSSVSL
ncbi:hypothetical protein DACRYDRAFT_20845 [Dacryopinax primogenitus]|uniref:Uncharacterized protein n=1 Tax=Dacryopinax primogenitus (strain DJM 731) TaxID=1858805 RepID=M5G243_DACPD|nr:uncharacterized protein DACRYDRAFT_20845 [Dacryopinax primogenitus]EJU04261.1 hypothetical protein DACRYDRAFT_20845 [Dacryopinax primogenitus]